MNTRQANEVVVALTRLTGEPVYLERNFIGEKTPEVLVGTIARFERTGPRQMILKITISDVQFRVSSRRSESEPELEIEIDLNEANAPTWDGNSLLFLTKAASYRHGDFERYVVKAGAAAEEYQPA